MLTLSFGFQKPQTGDKGSVFFTALEQNIQRLNDHTHDGTNSSKLTAASSVPVTAQISAASWAAVSGQPGTYSQVVTLPGALSYDTCATQLRIDNPGQANDGHVLGLSIEKVSSISFKVYINDPTLNLKAFYVS